MPKTTILLPQGGSKSQKVTVKSHSFSVYGAGTPNASLWCPPAPLIAAISRIPQSFPLATVLSLP